MFPDFIRETEIYQYILQEGRELGIEQGLEQAFEQGHKQGREQVRQEELQSQRQSIIAFVQARAAELIPLAQRKAEEINNIETLNELILNVFLAQSAEDIRRYLEEVKDK